MDSSIISPTFWERMLRRTGGWYLVVTVAIAQILATLGVIAASYSIQVNAEFTRQQLAQATSFILVILIAGNVILLLGTLLFHREARQRLTQWARGEDLPTGTRDELIAWRQVTSLAWRYGMVALLVGFFVDILPLLGYQYHVLGASPDKIIYTLLGSIVSALGSVMLAVLVIDRMLTPAREVLLPKEFDAQLSGATGVRISIKLQTVILALIISSVLLVAPIGYHQTATALATGAPSVLRTMQIQSIVVTVLELILGMGISLLMARSVSQPLRHLVETFNKVETGDLKQRARIIATDEVGELAVHFNRMISPLDELQGTLEQQVVMQTEQLKATFEVGRVVSSILDPEELISKVVNLITDRLGYYYAAIFLIDPGGRWAELQDATGEAGRMLKEKKHRLEIGGKNMVGAAISTRQPRIALDVGQEAVRFDNPLLPHTRSEIALPLIVGDRVLGALDAQSTEENAFGPDIIDTLQGMANQVAIALENARLFQETQRSLQEIRAAQRQYLAGAWSETLQTEGELEFSVGRKTLKDDGSETAALNVPLSLREQIIGQITLEGDEEWSSEERGWIEAVATQAALALENARLLEESQQLALHERLVAEITSKIWTSATIDNILQTAAQELGRTLGASEAVIELKVEE